MSKEFIYKTIKYSVKNKVAWVTLNRPEIHNAFNETMIGELLELYQTIGNMPDVRVAVITGAGKSFCAGADLNWMGGVIKYSYEQNLNESLQLAELFYTMYSLPKPTIAMVNGAAIGGGAGMVAVNDFVIASDQAKFSFSEVKLGLVPACISPYVIRKVGENRSQELFLSGERMDAQKALQFGFANQVVPTEELKAAVDKQIDQLMSSGPNALAICKDLLEKVPQMSLEQAKKYTAEAIAALRVSDEGQEGMQAFFEKRKPKWVE
ncbi:MAG: enoyl-CoA hydratase/isomerase family protein [bacterium]|jgi:methylglutaconyl-CoA hydratase|nr:enoyl-CoA hydratase/isomerase family protein [bacterium]